MAEPDALNPQLFDTGDVVAVRAVELHRSDDPQRHREKLARILLDEMYQFVGLLDAQGTLIDVNRNALEGAGIELNRTLGLPFWEARWWQISRETQDGVRDSIHRAARGEFVRYDVEIYGRGAGEDTIIIDYSLVPIRDRGGRVVMLLAEGRDITEKKRAELEIARKNQELQRLLDRLREIDEIKTQFFANVSHELRTPLALVLGPVERALAEGGPSERQRRDLEVARGNAAVLLKQVNDLLDLSKLDAGRMALDYVAGDLSGLLRRTAAHFDALAPQRDIAYAVDAPDELPAEVDAAKLERVVLNLLSNAFKFTPPGGRVHVSLREDGARAVLVVQDSGPGVPEASRALIFERFRQADGEATREQGGTGLGLAIARDFVDLHGGTIGVTEAPGGGALFQVDLPLRAPEGTHVRRARDAGEVRAQALGGGSGLEGVIEELRRSAPEPEPKPEPEAPSAPVDGRPTALVVEDNPDLRRFIRESLSDRFRVATAVDGQDGLEKARELSPDVIVSDLMMPRLSGDRMALALREDPKLRDTPILILSARADDALRLRLLRGTVQDYLVKPFSAGELVARAGNLATLKRTRDVLRGEVAGQQRDIEALAREVADRNRELRDAVEATRVALVRAEAASEAKGDFMRLVSHELRNPLTSVVLHLDLLRRAGGEGWTDRQRDLLGRMDEASRRLVEVVGAVLDQSQIGARDFALDLCEVDLGALAADVAGELAPRAEAKGLALVVEGGPAGPLLSDPRLLRLLLRHLVENAIKFTDRGEVRLRLDAEGGGTISVADTGRGIAPEERARIFEPFREGGDVRHKHEVGLGLGLAIVRQVVDVLGGQLQVESAPGRGSTFTATLASLVPARAA